MKLWARLKASCLHSLTIAWGYLLAAFGLLLQGADATADAFGDPSLKEQLAQAIGDTRTVGRIMVGISVVTILARLRSLRRQN